MDKHSLQDTRSSEDSSQGFSQDRPRGRPSRLLNSRLAYLFVVIGLLTGGMPTTSYAATQGKTGATSTGSVNIALTIPPRLSATVATNVRLESHTNNMLNNSDTKSLNAVFDTMHGSTAICFEFAQAVFQKTAQTTPRTQLGAPIYIQALDTHRTGREEISGARSHFEFKAEPDQYRAGLPYTVSFYDGQQRHALTPNQPIMSTAQASCEVSNQRLEVAMQRPTGDATVYAGTLTLLVSPQ